MSAVTGLTFGGSTWIPKFLQEIDWSRCLGCGRCFKVCGRGVMQLKAMNEEGEFVEDEHEEESERKVMVVVNADNCVGCEACSRICPKKCHVHVALA